MGTVRDERMGFVRTISNHSNRKFNLTYALFQYNRSEAVYDIGRHDAYNNGGNK